MKVEIVGNDLVITAPIKKEPSKSGKSILIASSGGNKPTAVVIDGKNVVIGLNAYISAD
jgi:hypothetical protein